MNKYAKCFGVCINIQRQLHESVVGSQKKFFACIYASFEDISQRSVHQLLTQKRRLICS